MYDDAFKLAIEMVMYLYALLLIKHFICDFPLQTSPYMYTNKGTYGHPGGLIHAAVHGIGTFAVFAIWFYYNTNAIIIWKICLVMAMIDMFVHYHIDWAKMSINKRLGWGPTTHSQFWILLGVDQLLHNLTYVAMILWLFK